MQLKQPIDLGQQLNSVYALKYLWLIWSIIGIHPPRITKKHFLWRWLYYMHSAVIHFLVFCFPASMLANLLFIETWEERIGNLSTSITAVSSTVKALAVLKYRWRLLHAKKFLQQLDLRCNAHPQDRMTILSAVRYCHIFCLFYVLAYVAVANGFAYIGWANHKLPYNAYFPTFYGNNLEANYIAAFTYQFFAQTFISLQNACNDMYPLFYVVLVNAHLEALANRIARIGNEVKARTSEENIEELRQCIHDHKLILGYFDCVGAVISTTLFFQFFITAFVLCLTAINIIAFDRDFAQQFVAIAYLAAVMVEVFPVCWYANVLIERTECLTTAMYSCNWINQNQLFRKLLIIFMQRSQKSNIILAGNMLAVSLQTFVAIIRFSFSMFTLLIKMKM